MDTKDVAMYEALYHACGVRGVRGDVQVEVLLFFKQCGGEVVVSNRNCKVHKIT